MFDTSHNPHPIMPHHYQFEVAMSCSGCSNAVKRAMDRLEGVTEANIDLKGQSVDVTTADSVDYDTVHAALVKTGKQVKSGKVVD